MVVPDRQSAPYVSAAAVTPSNTADLNPIARGLWVGGAGNLSVILANDDSAVSLLAVAAGTHLNMFVKRVRVTGTTATNIVALN
jgi:hypothetical protein